jgi:hypothetical protein
MGRPKGSRNRKPYTPMPSSLLSTPERIELLATIIIERIMDDYAGNRNLLRKLKGKNYAGRT